MLLTLLPAYGNQVFYEPLPLEEVVQMSTLIAVVKRAGKTREHSIRVPKAPKFVYVAEPLVVEKVVHDPGKLTEGGATIEVVRGDLGMNYSQHILYEVEGIMESPIVQTYESPVPHDAIAWVAMIGPCSAGDVKALCLTVPGAREKLESLDRIRSILEQGSSLRGGKRATPTPATDPKKTP